MKCDALPRNVKRPKSDNRVRMIAEDMIDLCDFLDEKALVGQLSVYVAREMVLHVK